MIRHATKHDIPKLVTLCHHFYTYSEYQYSDFDPEVVTKTLLKLLNKPREHALLLVAEEQEQLTGVLLAVAAPLLFCSDWAATELMWWVEEDHRSSTTGVRLLQGYELWCKKIGVKYASMTALASNPDVEKIYDRFGFKKCEMTYLKEMH